MKEENDSVLNTTAVEWINQDVKELLNEMETLVMETEGDIDLESEIKNTETFLKLLDQMNDLEEEMGYLSKN